MTGPAARVEVVRATLQQISILENLLELYAEDFREFHAIEPGPDGRFVYPGLSLYWQEEGRHPFFIHVDGEPAGFALVQRGSRTAGNASAWDMAEFFILREGRRRGAGTKAAHQVFRLFPGLWEVRVMQANRAALHFWERALSQFTGKTMVAARQDRKAITWHGFSFESPTPEK
jgi:predicted acetyltransferase